MKEFRIVVAGGREFSDFELMCRKLDRALHKKKESGYRIIVVSGTARGADKLGERYAKLRGYAIESMPADWDRYGKSAGYRRNADMAKVADGVVVFWDGVSKGTSHMIDLADRHQKKCIVVHY